MYLLFFVASGVSEVFFRSAGTSAITAIPDDGSTLARALATHADAFRAGFGLNLVADGLYAVLMALFYRLLRPVDRTIALAALVLAMIALAVQVSGAVAQLAGFGVAQGIPTGLSEPEAFVLVVILLRMNAQAAGVALVFWAPYWLLTAALVFRSTFLPRWLAVPLALAGLGWLTFLWPPLAASAPVAVVGGVAEIILMLWLLVRGVDEARWRVILESTTRRPVA